MGELEADPYASEIRKAWRGKDGSVSTGKQLDPSQELHVDDEGNPVNAVTPKGNVISGLMDKFKGI